MCAGGWLGDTSACPYKSRGMQKDGPLPRDALCPGTVQGVAGQPHAGCGCRGWWARSSSPGCQALDSICCNKSGISLACAELPVLGDRAALLVLSGEREETRAGREEVGCGRSLGKARFFPGRLNPPLSLISSNARSGLAQQKADRSRSSSAQVIQGFLQHPKWYMEVFCAHVLSSRAQHCGTEKLPPQFPYWECPARDAGLCGHTPVVEAVLAHVQDKSGSVSALGPCLWLRCLATSAHIPGLRLSHLCPSHPAPQWSVARLVCCRERGKPSPHFGAGLDVALTASTGLHRTCTGPACFSWLPGAACSQLCWRGRGGSSRPFMCEERENTDW